MKIIDLLNKIANDEEVPNKIKYNERIYEYVEEMYWYLRDDMKSELTNSKKCLNNEVKIIEENKKIEKIEKIEKIGFVADGTSLYFNGKYQDGSIHGVTPKEIAFAIKINELIEEINKLKENKYEK